jgi:hypothetical protein
MTPAGAPADAEKSFTPFSILNDSVYNSNCSKTGIGLKED